MLRLTLIWVKIGTMRMIRSCNNNYIFVKYWFAVKLFLEQLLCLIWIMLYFNYLWVTIICMTIILILYNVSPRNQKYNFKSDTGVCSSCYRSSVLRSRFVEFSRNQQDYHRERFIGDRRFVPLTSETNISWKFPSNRPCPREINFPRRDVALISRFLLRTM